jgi:hypothetical protein
LLRDVSRGLSEYTYREKEARKLMSKGGRALLGRREETGSSSVWYSSRVDWMERGYWNVEDDGG